jgi:hypothetical protein
MVRHGARAARWHLELDELRLVAVELPHADRAVVRGRGKLAVVRVDGEAVDDVGVRAHEGGVLEGGHVEDADGARVGAQQELEAVRAAGGSG